MSQQSKTTTIILFAIFIISIAWIGVITFQKPQTLIGVVENKTIKEQTCTNTIVFDPALQISVPKETCNGPYWYITIAGKTYQVTKQEYAKIKKNKSYAFRYYPIQNTLSLHVKK